MNGERPAGRGADFVEDDFAPDVLQPRDIGPVSLKERLIERQLRLGENFQATPLAHYVHFHQCASQEWQPGAVGACDFSALGTHADDQSAAKLNPLNNWT